MQAAAAHPPSEHLSLPPGEVVAIVPARLGSTRFPEKVLASQTGRPLVQHVVDRVKQCPAIGRVLVATDHRRVADALLPYGTEVVMTSSDHPSGTDRIAEVARDLRARVIVNVQGDEPEIEPASLTALVALMGDPSVHMGTLATPLAAGQPVGNPNLVKVVLGEGGRALYFSRAPIPHDRDSVGPAGGAAGPLLHLGVYAYRRDFLLELASWPQTPLERTEKLEQLRVLERGHSIRVAVVSRSAHGIDTAEQYDEFVRRVASH